MAEAADREKIWALIERYQLYGYSITPFRSLIEKKSGRALLTASEAEAYLDEYRGIWGVDEYPILRELEFFQYGDHWKQCWWLMRDLVTPTREVRKQAREIRRKSSRCAICKTKLERRLRRRRSYVPAARDDAFRYLIADRHFTDWGWERSRPGEVMSSRRNWQAFEEAVQEYDRSFGSGTERVCGYECEATRFSRWLGMKRWQNRIWWKQYQWEGKERQWIRRAKETMRQVHKYLNPRASISQPTAFRPESISHGS